MSKILFFFVTFFISSEAVSQSDNNGKKYKNIQCDCNSTSTLLGEVSNNEFNKSPYNYILHFGVKYFSNDKVWHGTASFISTAFLITVDHLVYPSDSISYIELALPFFRNQKWIRFTPNEFKVFHYSEEGFSKNQSNDLAVIALTNENKIRAIYNGHFEISNVNLFNTKITNEIIHLTGYPCSKFGDKIQNPDTLTDRISTLSEVELNSDTTLLGHNIYSCAGDSGSPIWISVASKPSMVAINEGLNNPYTSININEANVAIVLNKKISMWIKKVISEHKN